MGQPSQAFRRDQVPYVSENDACTYCKKKPHGVPDDSVTLSNFQNSSFGFYLLQVWVSILLLQIVVNTWFGSLDVSTKLANFELRETGHAITSDWK